MEVRERDWGSLAPELISLVLQKVQDGVGNRGEGRRVVAVAGVCRAWRRSVHQELDRSRPASLLTFPVSTRQPAPSATHLQCLLKKSGDTFRLVQVVSGDEYFLLGARKKYTISSTYFRISADPRVLWMHEHDNAVRVTSNFWRTAFTLQDEFYARGTNPNPKTTLSLKYEEVAIAGNCLRRICCKKLSRETGRNVKGDSGWRWLIAMLKWNHLLNLTNPVNHSSYKVKNRARRRTDSLINRSSSLNEIRMFSLRNKDPDWHDQEQRWSLDFQGRGSIVPSVHNFQLVSSDESSDGRVIMQLGKLCKGLFILDFGAPLSALEALAISLTSFATSVALDT